MLGARVFGRSNVTVPPIWWKADRGELLQRARRMGDWVVISTRSEATVPEDMRVAISVSAAEILPRNSQAVQERLARMGRASCDAVILEDAMPTELKGGRLFHRLSELRENEVTAMLILAAQDALAAEWMVESTAAHGVIVPFSRADQSAAFRVLDKAAEVGCGLLAFAKDFEDIRLILAEPRIAAAIMNTPESEVELEELERIARAGPDIGFRDSEWEKYRMTHEAPPKLRSSHPPEYGA